MPDDFMLDMALRHFDFNDAQIARIKADIPKAAYVAGLIKHNWTVITELMDAINMVAAQVAKKEGQ